VPPDAAVPPLQSDAIEDRVWGLSSSSLGVGWHTVKGDVDTIDAILEANEGNNTLQDSFQIVSASQ